MPLLCAENAFLADADSNSTHELLLALLCENGARRSWRTTKASVAKPGAPNPVRTDPPGGRILSFSGLCCINDSNDDEDDSLQDLDCGIMLEAPEFK